MWCDSVWLDMSGCDSMCLDVTQYHSTKLNVTQSQLTQCDSTWHDTFVTVRDPVRLDIWLESIIYSMTL